MFSKVPHYPGDPIYTLVEAFQKDARQDKVSLSIGVYCNETGKVPYMQAVQSAERLIAENFGARPYLPMEGMERLRFVTQRLLFGDKSEALQSARIATVQTVGASGALRLGADFLNYHLACKKVWVSDFTWEAHQDIFQASGYEVSRYPYYDAKTGGVDFDALRVTVEKMDAKDVIILHACAHNPTGADLSREQWVELVATMVRKGVIPFLDLAYQGFAKGLEDDAFAVRALLSANAEFLIANSFSKNFALYGERVGALSVVCQTASEAEAVLGQLKSGARKSYSSPSTHGARVVVEVLENQALTQIWRSELEIMRKRVIAMRTQLHAALETKVGSGSVDYLVKQSGMFSFTGLSTRQIDALRNEFGVYLVGTGRICIAGLTDNNVSYVADAMAHVMVNEKSY